jgi:hypothetical protein
MVNMADITVTFSDGSTHVYENVPNAVTREEALKRVNKDFSDKSISDISRTSFAEMPSVDIAQQALANVPASAGRMASDIYQAVTSPVKTAKTVLDIGAGTLQNLLPESLVRMIGEDKPSREVASQVGEFYKQRYGSEEGLKKAVATDPIGVMADLSTILTGGAAVTPKVASIPLKTAAKAIDPLSLAIQGASQGANAIGKVAAPVLGMTTGTGTEPIRQAFKAGAEGGERGKMFTENLRGTSQITDVLDSAKQNLATMNQAKQAEYRANMTAIKTDKTVLGFDGIDKSIDDAIGKVTFKGQVKNESAANKLGEVQAKINEWKSLDPTEFHTPEGLDALKQQVGDILESIPFEQKTARLVVGDVYNSVKKEISQQAPTYAKTMKAYSDASDQIKEIERALSLGQKASADTALRKLQSIMRNNVNTNYGQRMNLAAQLEASGGRQMMPALAGQALSELTPRGIQRATAPIGGIGLFSTGGLPAVAGGALVSSPRIVGEAAYGAGVGARGLLGLQRTMPEIDYPTMFNLLYQSQQPKD